MNTRIERLNRAIESGGLDKALPGLSMPKKSGICGTKQSDKTAKNKNFLPTSAKRLLTSIDSTLELPVKENRKMGRKLSHINAGTYS